MKGFFTKIVLAALFFIASSESAMAALETYIIDPTHTFATFHISHFGFSSPTGKWMASGTLVLDQANPANSKLDVTIPLANLVTGVAKLDEHLKSKDFFDVQKYPTATFVSNKIDVTGVDAAGRNTAKVTGILTLHGVAKPITLDVVLNRIAISPITHKKTAGFSATGVLNRSDYDITAYLPGLSDQVNLDMEMEAATG